MYGDNVTSTFAFDGKPTFRVPDSEELELEDSY